MGRWSRRWCEAWSLVRASWNWIFCVPGFIHGRTQGESAISSFCFWCYSRKLRCRGGSRFSCVTPWMERLSRDLPRAVKASFLHNKASFLLAIRCTLFSKKNFKFTYLINWLGDWFQLVIFSSLVRAWTGDHFDIN